MPRSRRGTTSRWWWACAWWQPPSCALFLFVLDTRLPGVHLSGRLRVSLLGAAGAAALVLVFALHVPSTVGDQYDRFVDPGPVGKPGDLRTRLTDPANNGRVDQWEVALNGFEASPLHGEGAATYALLWASDRPDTGTVTDAHSLYAEVLGELGMVGLVLLAVPLLLILGTAAARGRGPHRTVYAAVLGAGIAWAVHAGIDWDWEMPAVTLWLFAVGGMVLASPGRDPAQLPPPALGARIGVVTACVALAVVPALVLISQARLDDSLDHFKAGDCPAAIDSARDSSAVLGIRAEPYEIVGYCEMRDGSPRRAVVAMEKALDRDPDNWEYRYGLALARAVAGQDPRSDALIALRLNPRDEQTRDAVKRFSNGTRRQWRRRATRPRQSGLRLKGGYLVLGLPHFEGPGCLGLPGCCEDGGQYWLLAELLELAAELGPPDFAITAVPLVIRPMASAMLTTRRELLTAPCRMRRGSDCDAWRIARSLARSSSCPLAAAAPRPAARLPAAGRSELATVACGGSSKAYTDHPAHS